LTIQHEGDAKNSLREIGITEDDHVNSVAMESIKMKSLSITDNKDPKPVKDELKTTSSAASTITISSSSSSSSLLTTDSVNN